MMNSAHPGNLVELVPGLIWQGRQVLQPEQRQALFDRLLAAEGNFVDLDRPNVPARHLGLDGDVNGALGTDVRVFFADLLHSVAGRPENCRISVIYKILAYRHLDFMAAHTDTGGDTQGSILLFMYYLRKHPASFIGGELRIWLGEQANSGIVTSEDNSIVVFRPHLLHEALRTYVPSGEFADSRFVVGGYLKIYPHGSAAVAPSALYQSHA